MNTLYVTYCSWDKFSVERGSPKQLYKSKRIINFIKKCEKNSLNCAILSAKYGLFFPDEINDPRKICKDVTNLGRCGNGDVEVSLEAVEEIPYIMSLIRQSFETQIGSE
ncbi:MAG: hypothetical protein ACTSQY_03085 [Candidatus Odinarchaeia archaeon]